MKGEEQTEENLFFADSIFSFCSLYNSSSTNLVVIRKFLGWLLSEKEYIASSAISLAFEYSIKAG